DAGHAYRLARDLDLDARAHRWQHLARLAHHFAGEELEQIPGARRLAHRLGPGLALLAREQRAELVLAREDLVADLVEHVGARLDRPARPRRRRGLRRPDRGARLGLVRARELADHVGRIGGVNIWRLLARLRPVPVDEILVYAHRRQMICDPCP